MSRLPESAAELLASDAVGHVVTINEDGSPHVSLAWVSADESEVVLATLGDQRKLQNLRRDPRVAISIAGTKVHPPGLKEYLVVYGTARITEGGAPEMLQELARTYLGPDVRFPPMDDPPAGFVTRVTVDRVGGVGPWSS
ncbi:MAG TPA: TIGR03618 family F420-dependent PPOX class oxidoreductase [Actinomycetota bacterium]|nr:TIGR03618 family F420-dependent PPOX class oxidoreductase [Actinomycetota bacterium]